LQRTHLQQQQGTDAQARGDNRLKQVGSHFH
jgi:hypothetical protein